MAWDSSSALRLQVAADLLGSLAGLLDDPVRLVFGGGQLLLVISEQVIRIDASRLGLLKLALDLLAALLEQLVDPRDDPHAHELIEEREREDADDQLRPVRIQILLVVGLGHSKDQNGSRDHGSLPQMMKEKARPNSASASIRPDADEHGRADLAGILRLAGHRLHGLADQDPQSYARSDRRKPNHQASSDRL